MDYNGNPALMDDSLGSVVSLTYYASRRLAKYGASRVLQSQYKTFHNSWLKE